MIKSDLVKNIIDIFQEHERFEYIDFKISIEQDILNIVYLIDSKYYMRFQNLDKFNETKNNNLKVLGENSPGRYSMKEEFEINNIDDIYAKIKNWLNTVWDKISFASPLAILEEEQNKLDEICKKFDYLDDYFTTDEMIDIKKELFILKEEFAEELKILMIDEPLYLKELNKLHKDFETLEETLPYLQKKGWIRNLTGRILHNSRRISYSYKKILLNQTKENNIYLNPQEGI